MLFFVLGAATAFAAEDPREFFESRIRPLLAKNCFSCHTSTRMGGLEMASRESLLKGGNSGPALVPRRPEESLLIRAVRHTHERLKMPLGGKLEPAEVADLAAWVKMGAPWPEQPTTTATPPAKDGPFVVTAEHRAFWSFQPVRKPPLPRVADKSWARGPIDSFILAKLEERGLKPVRPADKRTLLRRTYYDLIGLPPAPEDVDAFLKDSSPQAFARVVDRLLASSRYGERWGRYWLDVARYSDDKLNSTQEEPYPNAYRYRNWVIQAFNQDMAYDRFVKAQIAGDLMEEEERRRRPGVGEAGSAAGAGDLMSEPDLAAGLGFYALRPEFQDDRVDATTRGFLGLTVACAQCHDHKYDPVPTQDYYSLLGIFAGTENYEVPLVAEADVKRHKQHRERIEKQEAAIKEFLEAQSRQLGEILAARTSKYLLAASGQESRADLDQETVERWAKYLEAPQREHPFLKDFEAARAGGSAEQVRKAAEEFKQIALAVVKEKKEIDEKNLIRLGGSKERRVLSGADLLSLERDKYFLWRDLFAERRGVYHYGDKAIDRFLSGEWKAHLERMRADLLELKRALPPQYPYLHAIRDSAKLPKQRVHIRGNRENLGEEAPRRFLAVLSEGERAEFTKGSGRLELADAIASAKNPLTPRVMVNRIWMHHFGQGIVRTPSNFGMLGERPTHPELLDYLAARFIESNWSIKAMHREIMLSGTYALSAQDVPKNAEKDPDNRLLWRANRRRLDAEALRDSLLHVAGNLDLEVAGPPARGDANTGRAVYGYVSRRKLDPMLGLFDFANPNSTSEQRIATDVPLQRLFFLNSNLILRQSEALARRLEGSDAARIRQVYRLVYSRAPVRAEMQLGLEFVRAEGWARYAQVLLSSNEFLFVN
jgi:hypothetical protein